MRHRQFTRNLLQKVLATPWEFHYDQTNGTVTSTTWQWGHTLHVMYHQGSPDNKHFYTGYLDTPHGKVPMEKLALTQMIDTITGTYYNESNVMSEDTIEMIWNNLYGDINNT